MSMMNKLLLKSEAVCMLAVNMETQSPTKSETSFTTFVPLFSYLLPFWLTINAYSSAGIVLKGARAREN